MLRSHNEIQFYSEVILPLSPITAPLLGTATRSEICAGIEILSTHSRSSDLIHFGRVFSVFYIRIRGGASRLLVTLLLSHSSASTVHVDSVTGVVASEAWF
jgi:hypothetical protein